MRTSRPIALGPCGNTPARVRLLGEVVVAVLLAFAVCAPPATALAFENDAALDPADFESENPDELPESVAPPRAMFSGGSEKEPDNESANGELGDYQELLRRLDRAEQKIAALSGEHQPANHEAFLDEDGGGAVTDPGVSQELSSLRQQFQEFKENASKIKYPNVEVHGVFQADTGWFSQDANSRATVGNLVDGSDFRRARMSANGAVAPNMNYFFQMDYAFPGRPTFTDVWMELTKVPILGNVRVGQWKMPFSLEVVSSFRYTTFPERSLLFQAFTPFRHIAVGFYDWAENERMTWAAAVYRPGQDQYGDSISDRGGYAGVGRITALPWWDDACNGSRYLHLGAAYNYVAPNLRLARFRTIPEFFIGESVPSLPLGTSGIGVPQNIDGVPFFVDTRAFPVNHYNLIGTEALLVRDQFSLQSEFQFNSVTRTNGSTVHFPGLYATAAYFLTGEHRPYLKKAGAIDRVKVLRNVGTYDECGCGWGAWELAARYSYLDLDSQDIQGGMLTDMTLGLNWYLNSYSKIQFNYIRAWLDHPTTGKSNTDIFGLRAQVDF